MFENFETFTWKCRVCGCTDDDCSRCIDKTGQPCHWVSENLCSACSDQEKRFPIQRAGTVPWKEAERAYKTYSSLYGKSQSLERLAERHGFGIGEFCCLYIGKNPGGQSQETVEKAIVVVSKQLKDDWRV